MNRFVVTNAQHAWEAHGDAVFELGFEGINLSPRHKSGIAVRFPRMLRIRDDKPIHEADTLATLKALLCRWRRRPHQGNTEHVSIIGPNLIGLAYQELLAICLIAGGLSRRRSAFR